MQPKLKNNTTEEKLQILHTDHSWFLKLEDWWSVKPVNDLKKILEVSQKEFDDFKISCEAKNCRKTRTDLDLICKSSSEGPVNTVIM